MLFGYPIEAIGENWFHECIINMLGTIHSNPQLQIVWPEIIPEPYRERLCTRSGLRDRLINYQRAALSLSPDEIQRISNMLIEQNEIQDLLACRCNCETISDLPQIIHEPVRTLFEFGFKLLTDLKIRDKQYKIIYDSTHHICPFCGCEYFSAPGAPREALDHYLAESLYSFAGVNLRNLVPMGHDCNSKYKLAQDILYNEDGTRRRSYYPYFVNDRIQISLNRSEPFAGTRDLIPLPKWEIDIEPDTEETSTWDTIFHIKERYQRDVLDAEFKSWLREFSSWCKSVRNPPSTEEDIMDALNRYAGHLETMGMRDRSFLKVAVFRMLHHHYQQNNERLKDVINGVVIGGMA